MLILDIPRYSVGIKRRRQGGLSSGGTHHLYGLSEAENPLTSSLIDHSADKGPYHPSVRDLVVFLR